MADVAFHPEAQAEYEAALLWYQARSTRTAARFEAEVQRVLSLIETPPDAFPAYDDEHRFAVLRRFPYSIVYRPEADIAFVVTVAHSSRAARYWHGRA